MATAVPSDNSEKVFSLEECQKHTKEEDCWIIVHGKVYDVTAMLDEHPGGGDIIVSASGRDATDDFEDVGHSRSAREWLEKLCIGKYEGGDPSVEKRSAVSSSTTSTTDSSATKLAKALLPVAVIVVAVWLANYMYA
uniref:Cytochrome b5 n=1 Tax=Tetraselmis sp. GSL018 TaxID=582737 RepID=A0A061RYG6_9CHLO|eukprot:CAMPEP_0177608834 /NCGR_PEP_ID=MMETSP0419_2-20121207/18703_1 /TAXON_ID=582737 /ORGANISM="Tetraselmis sp., Strain GSL018" /LENGTH=136 /DNA_ID=CAMNT_0019103591 /DNA_START=46 /DNA_END=456 /DNA_ORIENTATION=-